MGKQDRWPMLNVPGETPAHCPPPSRATVGKREKITGKATPFPGAAQ